MTYNLGTVRARIEQKLDDTNFGVAKLNQFINDAQEDILNSRRFVFMEREADVTTNEGSQTLLNVPTDMQTPLSLRIHTPIGYATVLPYMEYEDFDRAIPNQDYIGNTIPNMWRVFNKDILIYPNPDTAYYLKLKYIKEVTELILDADVPEIPQSFGEALVLAGYKRALEHNDDFDQAQVIQQQIDEFITKMDERYKRQSGTPHIMRLPNRTVRRRGI
jgi:hypothetical protein